MSLPARDCCLWNLGGVIGTLRMLAWVLLVASSDGHSGRRNEFRRWTDGKEVGAMQWDLGLRGLALLVAMSLGFGVIAQLVVRRAATRWLWLIAAAGYFVGGLFISEAWFGWATQEELQPNIDGLSFDEVLLIGLVPGVVTVLVTWYVARRTRRHSTGVASRRSGTQRSRPASGAV
jgi:hypothetical protein